MYSMGIEQRAFRPNPEAHELQVNESVGGGKVYDAFHNLYERAMATIENPEPHQPMEGVITTPGLGMEDISDKQPAHLFGVWGGYSDRMKLGLAELSGTGELQGYFVVTRMVKDTVVEDTYNIISGLRTPTGVPITLDGQDTLVVLRHNEYPNFSRSKGPSETRLLSASQAEEVGEYLTGIEEQDLGKPILPEPAPEAIEE
jgi:hypothetical protein